MKIELVSMYDPETKTHTIAGAVVAEQGDPKDPQNPHSKFVSFTEEEIAKINTHPTAELQHAFATALVTRPSKHVEAAPCHDPNHAHLRTTFRA